MDEKQNVSDLKAAVDQARSLAREQVAAAWQLHIERVREELESGWRERLDQIFNERFDDVESRLRSGFVQSLENGLSRCRKEVADGLNETARRLRGAENREEWIRTLIEASAPHCGRAALFAVTPKGLSMGDHPPIPLASAPAFGGAIESKDTVVAVGTPRELSLEVSSLLGDASSKKVYLFPVVVRQNVVAVLYAEGSEHAVDVGALELLAFLAAASIDATETVVVKTPASDLIRITGASSPAAGPVWTELPRAQQELHLRAQRFARTRVAEMLLHKVRQVHTGRESHNLYTMLKEEIEAGREAFRREFIETCPSMVDYFHLELQRTLAKDDPIALGPDYPGPLLVGAVVR
jgi:hypothetical protein